MKKIALPIKGGREIEVDADRIMCNDIVLPCDPPHMQKTKLWVAWNQFGPMGAIWTYSDEFVLDLLVDADLARGIMIDKEAMSNMDPAELERLVQLGNAGEYCDLTYVGLDPVIFKPERDWKLMCRFAEARGAQVDRLGDL